MYKRKDKSNIINHKEYVSYIGSVDTFRILVLAKAVELEYQKYEIQYLYQMEQLGLEI